MSDNENSNGNEYWKDELKRLKEELHDLKREMKGRRRRVHHPPPPRPPKSPRPPKPPSFDFEKSLGNYFESVLGSVAEGLDSAFRGVFSTGHSPSRRRSRRYGSVSFTPEQEEAFFESAPDLIGLLADGNRLKLLKRLESGPKYQSDLVDDKLQGGTFKHHMSKLMDEGWVIQEKARGRYLIAISGREALKFAEFLFFRSKPDLFKATDENYKEEEAGDRNLRFKISVEGDDDDNDDEEEEAVDEEEDDDDEEEEAVDEEDDDGDYEVIGD